MQRIGGGGVLGHLRMRDDQSPAKLLWVLMKALMRKGEGEVKIWEKWMDRAPRDDSGLYQIHLVKQLVLG